jgi:hypothetical protein
MTEAQSTKNKKSLYIFAGFLLAIFILLFLPTNTIEGISLVDKECIRNRGTDMYTVIGQRPEQYAQVFLVSHTFNSDDRIETVKSYYLARLKYDIAVLEKKLGQLREVDNNLKIKRDKFDTKASEALRSLVADPSTMTLRTDAQGRFSKTVNAGKYFILIRSNRNVYNTSTEIGGEIEYKDDVWLFAFQSFRFEKVWDLKSKD